MYTTGHFIARTMPYRKVEKLNLEARRYPASTAALTYGVYPLFCDSDARAAAILADMALELFLLFTPGQHQRIEVA